MWEAWSRPNVTHLGQGRNKIQSIKLPLKSPVISTVAPITFNPALLTISCLELHANVCVKRERNVLPFRELKTFLSEVTLPRVIYTLGSFSTATLKTNFNLIVRQMLKDSHNWCGRQQNSICLARVLSVSSLSNEMQVPAIVWQCGQFDLAKAKSILHGQNTGVMEQKKSQLL